MSSIGSAADLSILQTAQAQQVASKARDREKASTEGGRREKDRLELRVAGVESADAIRRLPQNESEQAESEQRSRQQATPRPPDDERPAIDLQA
jgi:hypothetical protein